MAQQWKRYSRVPLKIHKLQLGITRTLLQKILKLDLKMFSYKIQMVQTLLPQDAQKHLQYTI